MTVTPDPALVAASEAAHGAWAAAVAAHDRDALLEPIAEGADGTPTSRIDHLVESAILQAVEPYGLDVVSEEIGHVDRGSSTAIVIDPVDGTGNATAGIPIAAFTGAIAIEGRFIEGLTHWLADGRTWWAHVDQDAAQTTSGRTSLDGALVSMIRPKGDAAGFLAIADRAARIRVLGCSSIEAALVSDGVLDAFVDAGSRTHRLVDLAAALIIVERAGGAVVDVQGEPIRFTTEVDTRWSGIVAATPELAAEIADAVNLANASATVAG
ncbi:MAG: inositol monophosphatase family protein [Actinomycetota bacterium]